MKLLLLSSILVSSLVVCAQSPLRLYSQKDNETILRLLDSTHNALVDVAGRLSDSQFFYHVDNETWSANDIVEHLGLIDEGYVRELWFALSQPSFPESFADSTKGGDEKAMVYATQPEKGKARGTNLPRNRYCNKETGIRIFSEANELAKDFYRVNANKDLRRYFIFRLGSDGVRTIRDLHQLGLLLVAHRIRHIQQLKNLMADSRFEKVK